MESEFALKNSHTHSKYQIFIDPSIGTAVLGLGPKDLINDLNTMGLFFETLCVRDLRIFADALDGQVFHYRDKSGLECDAVIHTSQWSLRSCGNQAWRRPINQRRERRTFLPLSIK